MSTAAHAPPKADSAARASVRSVVAVLAAFAACWIAGGGAGLLHTSLRHALMWLAMLTSITACWPTRWNWRCAAVGVGILLAVLMTASEQPVVNIFGIALLAAVISFPSESTADGTPSPVTDESRPAMLVAAQAVAIVAVWRLVLTGIPLVWSVADWASGLLGRVAGSIAGHRLSVGPTFAGLDLLVLMAAFYGLWLAATPPPRLRCSVAGGIAILAVHLVYLVVLALLPFYLPPKTPPAVPPLPGVVEPIPILPWLHSGLIPWNLPALGLILHLVVAAFMLRWAPIRGAAPRWALRVELPLRPTIAAAVVALLLPAILWLHATPATVTGKKIVTYKEGFLNWLRPKHGDYGRLSIGMYGMMDDFVPSLGGRWLISPDLSANDLKDADALVIIFPNKPWKPDQLQRIRDFVRNGGSLLVMCEHTIREADGRARFNDLLDMTAIRGQFDTAEWAIGGWLDSYQPIAHAITAGPRPDHNDFGVVIGCSLEARWPARPLILGRWGWCDRGDPGSPRAMMGNDRYDAGERLGDICLAAEQPVGKGKVIAFGDPSTITNGINIGAYPFTSSLYSYLAGRSTAQPIWRQLLALLAGAGAVVLLVYRPGSTRIALIAVTASLALVICCGITHSANIIKPNGLLRSTTQPSVPPSNNLAYIDAAHLGGYSPESLRDDGLMGLELTLMRNGFLTHSMGCFDAEALERAALFISIAPGREFASGERKALRNFVENGGVFVCTVGYEDWAPARSVLAEFGLRVGDPAGPDKEPVPWGHFKSPFINVQGSDPAKPGLMHYVRFHAAWPVAEDVPPGSTRSAKPLAYGSGNVPVILMKSIGKGKVVLIGDSGFAVNKNLEHVDGSPFEGMRENAIFWRWFLAYALGREPWLPPGPGATPGSEAQP